MFFKAALRKNFRKMRAAFAAVPAAWPFWPGHARKTRLPNAARKRHPAN